MMMVSQHALTKVRVNIDTTKERGKKWRLQVCCVRVNCGASLTYPEHESVTAINLENVLFMLVLHFY